MGKKAVVVLSGGLDSATCMAIAKAEGYDLYPLTFVYGQRHSREVELARQIAAHFQAVEHKVVPLDFLREIGGSSLTDANLEVRTGQQELEQEIPNTYVPARNLIFLSLAAAYAEVVGAEKIVIGVSAVDYSGYPDCRPEFIQAMEQTVNLATRAGTEGNRLSVSAPLIGLSKGETIKKGIALGVPYERTTSCYLGGEKACGRCDSCQLRIKGFREAGIKDPIAYEIEGGIK